MRTHVHGCDCVWCRAAFILLCGSCHEAVDQQHSCPACMPAAVTRSLLSCTNWRHATMISVVRNLPRSMDVSASISPGC